jgi:predicted protein tyrosine phosphatase
MTNFTRLLFVCGRNRRRSPTAEQIFSGINGVETRSAGINADAEEPLSAEVIEWADLVFVMEASQRAKLARMFPTFLRNKRVVCLGIPDDYGLMDARLIELLWSRVPRSVPALKAAKAEFGKNSAGEDESPQRGM